MKSEEANAKAFADAKDAAEEEIEAYVAAIDYTLYSDEAVATINGYVTAAIDAIESVTEISGFASVVADMKAKIEAVEKLAPVDNNAQPGTFDKIKQSLGCNSVVGLTTSVTLTAAAAAVVLGKKKKKED